MTHGAESTQGGRGHRTAADLFDDALDPETREESRPLISHARLIAQGDLALEKEPPSSSVVSAYDLAIGDYASAGEHLKRLLDLREEVLRPRHLDTLTTTKTSPPPCKLFGSSTWRASSKARYSRFDANLGRPSFKHASGDQQPRCHSLRSGRRGRGTHDRRRGSRGYWRYLRHAAPVDARLDSRITEAVSIPVVGANRPWDDSLRGTSCPRALRSTYVESPWRSTCRSIPVAEVDTSFSAMRGPIRRSSQAMAAKLARVGNNAYFDQKLLGGQDWWSELMRQIERCDVFSPVLTHGYMSSRRCRLEGQYAEGLQEPFPPIRIQEVDPKLLPPAIGNVQWSSFTLEDPESFLDLVGAIAGRRACPPLPHPLPAMPEVPVSYMTSLGRDRFA